MVPITAASVGRMREKTPHGRGDRLVDTLLAWWLAPDRELEPEINRFQVRVWQDGNPWIEPYGGGSR